MTLTEHSTQLLDFEEVDLSRMNLEELLRERADCKTEIQHIATQLVDPNRRPTTTEDDSLEWVKFRDWRRRARWALVYRKRELEDIKDLLRVRQVESHAERERKYAEAVRLAPESACHTQEEYNRLRASAVERRQTLLETLNSPDAPELLILRLYRVLRRLLPDGEDLPVTMDTADRRALSMASVFLRSRFTTGGVKDFVHSPGDVS